MKLARRRFSRGDSQEEILKRRFSRGDSQEEILRTDFQGGGFMDQFIIDNIYKNKSLEEIPWNMETPPDALVELVKSGRIKPCRCIDLGCGAGNYSVYLASQGFEVTGVDFSPTAISLARENAENKGVTCTFLVADILGGLEEVQGTFDFAFDWGVMHHILPEKRMGYIANVHRILNPGGKYLSACFSEKDIRFDGPGKYRKTSLGTVLYFSSEDELRELFSRYFKVIDLKTIEEQGKFGPHLFNFAFMEKVNSHV
jgi:SAM-dependent methyltransferase